MNTRLVGDSALLLEVEDAHAAQVLRAAIQRQSLRGVSELVPAYDTLLLEFDPLEFDVTEFIRRLPQRIVPAPRPGVARKHGIEVSYNGEDLDEVARLAGVTVADVIHIHSSATYTVAFLGFAPGFPYLVGLDPKLRVPRLKTPRTLVPAGAVAIADEFGGVYPQSTPGGWRIVGHTDAVLFAAALPEPALLMPGDTVHFRPVS